MRGWSGFFNLAASIRKLCNTASLPAIAVIIHMYIWDPDLPAKYDPGNRLIWKAIDAERVW